MQSQSQSQHESQLEGQRPRQREIQSQSQRESQLEGQRPRQRESRSTVYQPQQDGKQGRCCHQLVARLEKKKKKQRGGDNTVSEMTYATEAYSMRMVSSERHQMMRVEQTVAEMSEGGAVVEAAAGMIRGNDSCW